MNRPAYKYVSPPRFLKNMWDDERPSITQAVLLAAVTAVMTAMIYPATPGHWQWYARIPLALAVWTAMVWVLLSIPFFQRWVWEGK